jgi:pimeloyl-ACP methyl ester carboxylesterase
MDRSLSIAVPPPDRTAEPEGFVVVIEPGDRIHFLDWGGPSDEAPAGRPSVLLVHGLAATAWSWAPVARRLRSVTHVVAMDLRGHGLSDAPTAAYEPDQLAEDAIAVAEGAGLLDPDLDGEGATEVRGASAVIVGHGFGAIVAACTAARLGPRCARLVLVDGGWEHLRSTTGMEPDEWLRELDEPPEVLRSIDAFLADRAGFDPDTWDVDQERAARAAVTEVPAGHVVLSIRPHALARSVEAMFAYRPSDVLPAVEASIVALVATDDEDERRAFAMADAQATLRAAGRPAMEVRRFPGVGHNLMRYVPDEVTAAILGIARG